MSRSLKGQSSTDRDSGPLRDPLLLGGLLVGIAAVAASVLMVGTANSRDQTFDQLSALETTLFTVVILVLTTVGSVLISAYFSRKQAKREYVQLARPAWRRVVQLSGSAAMISEAVAAKKSLLEAQEQLAASVVGEWLDAFDRLMRQHSGQLADAISDWQELLPEDYAELRAVTTLANEINGKLDELTSRQAELALTQEAQSGDTKKAEIEARRRIDELTSEIADLRRKRDERITIPFSDLGGSKLNFLRPTPSIRLDSPSDRYTFDLLASPRSQEKAVDVVTAEGQDPEEKMEK